MNLHMNGSEKVIFNLSAMKSGDVIIPNIGNSLNTVVTIMAMGAGFFCIETRKKQSIDYQHDSKGLDEKIDKIQERLDRAIEKWGNNNMRP